MFFLVVCIRLEDFLWMSTPDQPTSDDLLLYRPRRSQRCDPPGHGTPQMALWINHHNPLEKSRFSMVFSKIFSYQVPLLPLFAWLSEEKVAFKSQGIPIFHSGSSFLDTRKATGWALYSVWSFLGFLTMLDNLSQNFDYVSLFLTVSDYFWLISDYIILIV